MIDIQNSIQKIPEDPKKPLRDPIGMPLRPWTRIYSKAVYGEDSNAYLRTWDFLKFLRTAKGHCIYGHWDWNLWSGLSDYFVDASVILKEAKEAKKSIQKNTSIVSKEENKKFPEHDPILEGMIETVHHDHSYRRSKRRKENLVKMTFIPENLDLESFLEIHTRKRLVSVSQSWRKRGSIRHFDSQEFNQLFEYGPHKDVQLKIIDHISDSAKVNLVTTGVLEKDGPGTRQEFHIINSITMDTAPYMIYKSPTKDQYLEDFLNPPKTVNPKVKLFCQQDWIIDYDGSVTGRRTHSQKGKKFGRPKPEIRE